MPRLLRHIVTETRLPVVAMVKALKTGRYTYQGQRYDMETLYRAVRKRSGKARILADVTMQLETRRGPKP